ncbi:recombinase family protein [Actinoplanes sp. NEAU-A12]|uniref:Recombinase family protein n=1 Tax=Actinoplanes sandaracinus TaxID=3045177 RepID=A0ABT6WVJ2_9ACTN|nr:recombinase family protein [Actinoplanes sandaracinus]
MFFTILAIFAEFEVDLLRMRTREGMATARAKGKPAALGRLSQRLGVPMGELRGYGRAGADAYRSSAGRGRVLRAACSDRGEWTSFCSTGRWSMTGRSRCSGWLVSHLVAVDHSAAVARL